MQSQNDINLFDAAFSNKIQNDILTSQLNVNTTSMNQIHYLRS